MLQFLMFQAEANHVFANKLFLKTTWCGFEKLVKIGNEMCPQNYNKKIYIFLISLRKVVGFFFFKLLQTFLVLGIFPLVYF